MLMQSASVRLSETLDPTETAPPASELAARESGQVVERPLMFALDELAKRVLFQGGIEVKGEPDRRPANDGSTTEGGVMSGAEISQDGCTLTVRVPLIFRKRGGRKLVIAPQGQDTWAPPRPRVDNTMVKAIARAFRWRKLLETGTHTTVAEIAAAEKINPSYLSRVLRLTLLAPDIVEAILDGRQPAGLQLGRLLTPFPVEWERQRALIRLTT
jgi:hypothetical protein